MHWIDPDCLPETVGEIDLFLLVPNGEVDGMILADGTGVHGHKPGDKQPQ